VSDAVQQSRGVATFDLDLKRIVIRRPGPGHEVDVCIPTKRTKKVITDTLTGYRIDIVCSQARAIRYAVDVDSLAQVPGKRSDVTDLHDRFETDVLLQAKREVVDRRRVRLLLDSVDRRRSGDRCSR